MQKPLAYLISSLRAKKTERLYGLIGGKSPIFDITNAQAKALEAALNKLHTPEYCADTASLLSSALNKQDKGKVADSGIKVYVAMRYWHPLIEEVVPKIINDGIKKIVALSLYPQYSVATTGSSLTKLKEVASEFPVDIYSIESWYKHTLYTDALVNAIRKGIESFQPLPPGSFKTPVTKPEGSSDVHVLFSAHSLPVRFVNEGDPYVEQIHGTISEITQKINISWELSYQSRSGPVQWLKPSTDEMIHILAHRGVKNLLIVPLSFVSDHIETLYEIDILYKKMAEDLGVRLKRSESLNTLPIFIAALKAIVLEGIKEAGWAE
jgi:ferrochelatase